MSWWNPKFVKRDPSSSIPKRVPILHSHHFQSPFLALASQPERDRNECEKKEDYACEPDSHSCPVERHLGLEKRGMRHAASIHQPRNRGPGPPTPPEKAQGNQGE